MVYYRENKLGEIKMVMIISEVYEVFKNVGILGEKT